MVEYIRKLERDGESPRAVIKKIRELPQRLDDLYSELIQDMKNRPGSLKLILLVYIAKRPLSTDELPWAMAMEPDSAYTTTQDVKNKIDFIPHDRVAKKIKMLGCGMVEVATSGVQVVQFIHQSVKDFFFERGLATLEWPSEPTSILQTAHSRFSLSCLRYMAMIPTSDPIPRSAPGSDFALATYAAEHWISHMQQGREDEQLTRDLLNTIGWPKEPLMKSWVDVTWRIVFDSSINSRPPNGVRISLVAAKYGLIGTLKVVLGL